MQLRASVGTAASSLWDALTIKSLRHHTEEEQEQFSMQSSSISSGGATDTSIYSWFLLNFGGILSNTIFWQVDSDES